MEYFKDNMPDPEETSPTLIPRYFHVVNEMVSVNCYEE